MELAQAGEAFDGGNVEEREGVLDEAGAEAPAAEERVDDDAAEAAHVGIEAGEVAAADFGRVEAVEGLGAGGGVGDAVAVDDDAGEPVGDGAEAGMVGELEGEDAGDGAESGVAVVVLGEGAPGGAVGGDDLG